MGKPPDMQLVGREDFIQSLNAFLKESLRRGSPKTNLLCLQSTRGSGKTQLFCSAGAHRSVVVPSAGDQVSMLV